MRHHRGEPTSALDALEEALTRAERSTRVPSRWRRRAAAALFAAAVVVVATVASYVGASYAYQRSEAHTDARIAVLEGDLSQRRSANAAANATRDAQIAALNALICTTLDHLTPRDDHVQEQRARYHCEDPPAPAPAPTR